MPRRRTGSRPAYYADIAQPPKPPKRHKGIPKGELARLRNEVASKDRMLAGLSRQIEHTEALHQKVVTKWKGRAKLWRRLFFALVGTPGRQPEDDEGSETVSCVSGPADTEC